MIIWIASYPKSGNTWVRSIISSYFFSETGDFDFSLLEKISLYPGPKYFKNPIKKPGEVSLFWEISQKDIVKKQNPTYLKTHNALVALNNKSFTSEKLTLGAIYIVRDPRNVVKSFSNHYNLTIDNATDVMINPKRWLNTNDLTYKVFLGSWSINYNSWKQMKERVYFVKYEDLVSRKKTTLLKIILGLLKPTSGRIYIDGVDASDLGLSEYRKYFGAVMQNDTLLSGTLAENISMFDPSYNEAKLNECCKLACISSDIEALPMGYHSLVGDMGSNFSGGQLQRLFLARALYKQPKILCLDESTSHLDQQNEDWVNSNIKNLDATRIIIAHRRETINSVDRIIKLS